MKEVTIGQVFKNYKELCEHLGELAKGGKSKQLQLLDWQRYFEYKREGNKFIITNVYAEPLEKKQRTSNNIKNIKPMIEYLQGTWDFDDCGYHSFTNWYCEQLELLCIDSCNIIYKDDYDITEYCKKNKIINKRLLCDYVSAAKQVLKNMFLKSLNYMQKKNMVEYEDGYMFAYALGIRSLGHFETDLLNDIIKKNETIICNEINKDHNLSNKLKGRQNLLVIYGKDDLLNEFTEKKLSMLMENEQAINICNEAIEDNYDNEKQSWVVPVDTEHPILSYYRGIAITSMDVCETDIQANGIEICNIIRKKARKQILNKNYIIDKYTGSTYYPYNNEESGMDILKIEKLLFQYFDEDLEDDTCLDLLAFDMDEELSEFIFGTETDWGEPDPMDFPA